MTTVFKTTAETGPAAGSQADPGGIRIGIGGWSYEPWRDTFYPEALPKREELGYASRRLTAIEINSTFYGSQKPATFAKWRDETPDNFIFTVKATRFATNRKVLADAGESIGRFIDSGLSELGAKLGPIVWQFAKTKHFEPDDFEAFLELLPKSASGFVLRHALDVRHPSFMAPAYLALARRHGCASVFTDSDEYPSFADLGAEFVYARLMRTDARHEQGVAPEAIDEWAERARIWRAGGEPSDLPRVEPASAAGTSRARRDVFLFFISGAKEKAPAAAMALLKRLER